MGTVPLTRLVVVTLSLWLSAAASAQPTYDLTGIWLLVGNDTQRSFCDGSSSQQRVLLPVIVTQDGESVIMEIPGENILAGRTSNLFVAAEESDVDASTILTGVVSQDISRITGTLVFFDRHDCPDAETGKADFVLIRIEPSF